MKAIINGVTIEGTPQEIAEYQRIVDADSYVRKPYEMPKLPTPDWTHRPVITCKTKDNDQ